MMKKYFLFFILSLSITGTYAVNLSWLEGHWKGEGDQPNAARQQTWSVEFDLAHGEKICKVIYASLACKSNWTLISAKGSTAIFKEKITEGFGECVDNNTVVIKKIKKNELKITFHYGSEKQPPNAVAMMKRS